MFSDHNENSLEINKRQTSSNTWKLNSTLLNNPWIKEKLEYILNGIKTKMQHTKMCEMQLK